MPYPNGTSGDATPPSGRKIAPVTAMLLASLKHVMRDAVAVEATAFQATERHVKNVRITTRDWSAISKRINRSVNTTTGKRGDQQ